MAEEERRGSERRTGMKTAKIYIVRGATGEYEDRIDWLVKAYWSLRKAKAHAKKAQRRASELFSHDFDERRKARTKNEFDKEMRMDYVGTWYYVETVEFENERKGE